MTAKRTALRLMIALTMGTSLILGGCDPTIQATVENGIINTTTSFLTSFFQAVLQVYTQDAPA